MSIAPSIAPVAKHRSRFWQAHFVVAVVVLTVGSIGLNAATEFMQLHFKKVPVAVRHEFKNADGLATRLGDWQMVSIDMPIPVDTEEALGTKQYVFRDYVDTRLVSKARLATFEGKSANERKMLLMNLQRENPAAVINAAVTYYTGLVDTVPHIPENCYVADGFLPVNPTNYRWPIKSPLLAEGEQLPVRFIDFEDQTGEGKVKKNVAYFFQTQGAYESDPLRVRFRLQNLFDRHGYFAKVEMMTLLKDREQSVRVMQDFLQAALPDIERCLPDYQAIKAATNVQTQPATAK